MTTDRASAQPGKRYVVERCSGGGDRAIYAVNALTTLSTVALATGSVRAIPMSPRRWKK
jgi:hypothetical protein